MYRLADAKWMGATQEERLDKLQDMITNHGALRSMIENGQKSGLIDNGLMDKIRRSSPDKRIGLLALLATILTLGMGPAALAIGAAVGGAGTAVKAAMDSE
jgi:hypothetical protein